jgi:hypothetical protein
LAASLPKSRDIRMRTLVTNWLFVGPEKATCQDFSQIKILDRPSAPAHGWKTKENRSRHQG